MVRREVLSTLRRQRIQEAVWDSISAVRVFERVIEIKAGGSEEGRNTQGTEQTAMWQMLEVLFWVLVVSGQSVAKVNISYTFRAGENAFRVSHNITLSQANDLLFEKPSIYKGGAGCPESISGRS